MSIAVKVTGLFLLGMATRCLAELFEYYPGFTTDVLNVITGLFWGAAAFIFLKNGRDALKKHPVDADKHQEAPRP